MEACKEDFTCTGGYHWKPENMCNLFGVDGAPDDECIHSGFPIEGWFDGFDCRETLGENFNKFDDILLVQNSFS